MVTLPPPSFEHLCNLAVEVGSPIEVGITSMGMRRMVPILGGTIEGPAMRGRVLAGGADFQLILAGGTQAHLDARYVVELDDGSRLFVMNRALRVASPEIAEQLRQGQQVDPDQVYFRCQPTIEAANPAWQWLHGCQIIGTGQRLPDKVILSLYRVL